MLSTGFALGVIGGLVYLLLGFLNVAEAKRQMERRLSTASSEALERRTIYQIGEQFDDNPQVVASKLIEEGDALLTSGNVMLAESRYLLIQKITGTLSNQISHRLAICAEQSQQPAKAARHFHRVLNASPSDIHRWIALSGISRTWIERGNRTEALQILLDLFIESMDKKEMPEEIQAQILYQLGLTLEDIALQSYHFDLTKLDGVLFQSSLPRVEELLGLIDGTSGQDANFSSVRLTSVTQQRGTPERNEPTSVTVKTVPDIRVTQRPSESIELITLDIDSPIVSITELVSQIAAACEVELFGSQAAQNAILARAKSIRANNLPASMLLDSLLLPFNVIWFQNEEGLHLVMADEDRRVSNAYFPKAMERFYRKLNLSYPGDYRTSAALLSRANLKLIQGEVDLAAAHYQELLLRSSYGEFTAKLFFNIGKIEMRLGRNQQAIQQFYLTVDQTYDTQLQAIAYWLIAQLCLEVQRLPEAIKAGGRSLALSSIDQQKKLATLTVARAYLLENQPLSANQILFNQRAAFAGSTEEMSAAILGSFARLTASTDRFALNAETERLLTLLANANDDDFAHFLDIYIAAKAWQRIGFSDRAIELLKLAIESTNILTWRHQFLFELGVLLRQSGSSDDAVAVFEFLTDSDTGIWRQHSMFHLSKLYLDRKQTKESLATSIQLLNFQLDQQQKEVVLHNMGTAYRILGKHHSAALCFAGMIPTNLDLEGN